MTQEKNSANKAAAAASQQQAQIGIAASCGKDTFERTQHPEAQWFGTAGLGLFIHWGISSVHGEIEVSWGMMADKPWIGHTITPTEYYTLADRFRPDRYDPDRWLAAAKKAGFVYAVLTTKHHDGYTLWPSNHGELGVGHSAEGCDLVGPYIEACRRNGLKVGLYYSPPDWWHDRKLMSFRYGSNGADKPHWDMDHKVVASLPQETPEHAQRHLEIVRGHVEELLTRYGRIDLMWFDGGPAPMSIQEIRQMQPHIVINPRAHGHGDFTTPECRMPEHRIEGWWELCEIWPKGPWGYNKRHETYKPLSWFLRRYAQVRSWGGNYLINVGPKPDGTLPHAYYRSIDEFIAWQQHSGESVRNVGPGPFPAQCSVPVTTRGSTWYLHLAQAPREPVVLRNVARPTKATLLRTRREIPFAFRGSELTIEFPETDSADCTDVIAVEWK